MNEIVTEIKFGAILFVIVAIGILIMLFPPIGLGFRFLALLLWLVYCILDVSQLKINEIGLGKIYLFNPFFTSSLINWKSIKEARVCYRSGITHGAMMPSYIDLYSHKSKKKRIYAKLSKEELDFLKSVANENGVEINVDNNPYDQSYEIK